MLDNPLQPEAVDVREEDDEVPVPPPPVVVEGAGESSGGEAIGKSGEEDHDDLVLLNQHLKRSRPSTSEVPTDSPTPDAGESTLGAPTAATRPPRSGHKQLRMGFLLRPAAAGTRLV